MSTRYLSALKYGARILLRVVVLSVLLLEVVLQIGAAYFRVSGADRKTTWLTDKRRVLSLGDSNTYGLWVDRSQAYPEVFETLWNTEGERGSIEVVNLGYPGANSSTLRREFPRLLRALRPDTVLLMVGVNDFWTAPVPIDEHDRSWADVLWYSRVYRVLYMLRRSTEQPKVDLVQAAPRQGVSGFVARSGTEEFKFDFRRNQNPRRPDEAVAALEENLRQIALDAAVANVELVLITYPTAWGGCDWANTVTRRVASTTGTPLVDITRTFQRRCPEWMCKELFGDRVHPTVSGHAVVAKLLVDHFHPPPELARDKRPTPESDPDFF